MTIDSSIWVATITGTLPSRAWRMTSFWMTGTSSSGTSTPRSPRATITASTSVEDAGQVGHDLRALELGHDGHVGAVLAEELPDLGMSAAERTNETATKSTPCRMPKRRSSGPCRSGTEAAAAARGSEMPL